MALQVPNPDKLLLGQLANILGRVTLPELSALVRALEARSNGVRLPTIFPVFPSPVSVQSRFEQAQREGRAFFREISTGAFAAQFSAIQLRLSNVAGLGDVGVNTYLYRAYLLNAPVGTYIMNMNAGIVPNNISAFRGVVLAPYSGANQATANGVRTPSPSADGTLWPAIASRCALNFGSFGAAPTNVCNLFSKTVAGAAADIEMYDASLHGAIGLQSNPQAQEGTAANNACDVTIYCSTANQGFTCGLWWWEEDVRLT
jgi:hypothetical protein